MKTHLSSKKMKLFQLVTWVQIFVQTFFPLTLIVPNSVFAGDTSTLSHNNSPFSADHASVEAPPDDPFLPYSDTLSRVATTLSSDSSDDVVTTARSVAAGYMSSSAQQWLNQFGTARIQLNVDSDGNWDESAFDFLVPLYDNKKSVLFTQLGLRAPDGRVTGNMGVGIRTFYLEGWMLGGNAFFDDDFTGKNRRAGFGAEVWTNNLKLSANTYVGTTDWHQSRDFDDYNEKPADGFDIRAEGYLPAYPQLGAKFVYEQYYGDKVALFDTGHLQSNPSAVTTGLSYTPVPLVQFAVNYKRGQDSLNDTQFQMNLRYDLGRPWAYQVDPDSVRLERSLAGSRYDLVERNNQIILQYKKQAQQNVSNLNLLLAVDNSAADGLTPNSAQVFATDKNGQPVRNAPIIWSATGTAKLATVSSVTDSRGMATVNFTNITPEAVVISAKSGAVTATQTSHFSAVTVSNIVLNITKDNSVSDGQTANHAQAVVTDINNRPVSNSKVTWKIDSPASLKNSQSVTDVNGIVKTDFTSAVAGSFTLTVSSGDKSASRQGHFSSNTANNVIDSIVVPRNNSPADGTSANLVTIRVKDSNGAPAANANVTLSSDKATVVFGSALKSKSATVFQTDSQGNLSVPFTDTVAETVRLTATLDNANSKTVTASFIADTGTSRISDLVVTTGALANGTATNQATVTVVDTNNNPLSGVDVTWSQSGSAVFGASAKTDATGKTTVTFTDTVAQTVNVTATVNGTSLSRPSEFVADTSQARVSDLTVTTGALANGTATNQATVTVVDSHNNPVSGINVTWSQSGSAVFGSSARTDATGKTTVTFTDTVAQAINVTATVNGSSLSKLSEFVADVSLAKISELTVTSGALANGTATNQATATVVDTNNNPLAGVDVTWSQNGSAIMGTSAKTDAAGRTTVTFTDTRVETVQVTATLANGDSQSKPSSFVAGVVNNVDVTMTTDNQIADHVQEDIAKVTVTDENGHRLANKTVAWSVSGNTTAVIASSTTTTDLNGEATIHVTAFSTSGPTTVTITALVDGQTGSTLASFIAKPIATTIDVVMTINNQDKDVGNQAKATVYDQYGDPMSGVTVVWDPGTASIVGGTSKVTNAAGTSIVTIKSNYSGSTYISAKVNGNTPVSNTVTAYFN
ncbi:Ig-like domain-containing protein [Enterobacter ludwigii]